MSNRNKFFPMQVDKNTIMYFYLPYILHVLWIFLSLCSIFTIGFSHFNDAFVIFSVIIRIVLIILGLVFFNLIFIQRKTDRKTFAFFEAFVGYGVVFTYVFYSLPRMVGEFNLAMSTTESVVRFFLVLFITLFPAGLYLIIRSDKGRITFGIYTKAEIAYEKKVKKDKVLRKKEHKKIMAGRNFFENLWYEWIDVIIQAIIIAMLIQQFFFQMYQIPSESMVPTFVKRDRVIVNKLVFGPHIPLTEWKLPSPVKPKVGDVVVFKNPEMDDPHSQIRYNNVFSRIFHPFVYMLTLSMVDIDKKKNGDPKERFIVKRMVAKEGEKICMVNDKVYKKTAGTDWRLMSDIPGQKEYGNVDLYYKENPDMDEQLINYDVRKVLDEAEQLIEKDDIAKLEKLLKQEKEEFIAAVNTLGKHTGTFFNVKKVHNYLNKYNAIIENLMLKEVHNYHFNISKYTQNEKDALEKSLKQLIDEYHYCVLYRYITVLNNYVINAQGMPDYLEKEIKTDIVISSGLNPYKKYMKRVNAVYKIYMLNFMSRVITLYNEGKLEHYLDNEQKLFETDFFNDLHNLYLISVYVDGFGFDQRPYSQYFDRRNFNEYPGGADTYFKKDEYFMMGDNRYNSHDSRFGAPVITPIYLDNDDKTGFAKKAFVTWHPRIIKKKHLLGKAVGIYYPVDRIKFKL